MDKKKKEFEVKDKRLFDNKGNLKEKSKKGKKPSSSSRKTAQKKKSKQPEQKARKADDNFKKTQYTEQKFNAFILSLSSSVYIYLGIIEDPLTKKKNKNLPAAKQMIDIIGMLKEKTSGNLKPDEESLINNILYELRMQYLSQCETKKT